MREDQIQFDELIETIKALETCNAEKAEALTAICTPLIGQNEAFDRAFCKAITRRITKGNGIPAMAIVWFIEGLVSRAKGTPWKTCFLPDPRRKSKTDKLLQLCEAVNNARARGLPTSKDGDPGPAFEEAGRKIGLSPATVRDKYYKNKDLAELMHEIAKEIVLGHKDKDS